MNLSRLLLKTLFVPRRTPPDARPARAIRNLLILELAGLGDAVLLTPLFRALKAARPEVRVSVLVSPRSAGVLDHNPNIDEMHTLAGITGLPGVLRLLRARRYDAILNAYTLASDGGALKMALLGSLIGANCFLGRDRQGRGVFFHRSIEEKEADPRHEVEWGMALLSLLEIPLPDRPWKLEVFPQAEHRQQARQALASLESGKKLVCLHPHSFRPTRRWPLENFLALGERLARRDDLVPLFTVSRTDSPRILEAVRAGGFAFFVSASPLALAALYDGATCVVVNDTGPLHLAVARGAPVVALFGPSDERRTRPWSSNSVVLKHPVVCSPCYYHDCPMQTHCMTLITVREAEATVLARSQAPEQEEIVSGGL